MDIPPTAPGDILETILENVRWECMLPATGARMFQEIKVSLLELCLEDKRPWLVGFSGGKDSTMLASLIFDAVLSIPADQRKKPISVLCIVRPRR